MSLFLVSLLFVLLTPASSNYCSPTFSCGTISDITYPFIGGDRPDSCGLPGFTLTCRNNRITEWTHNSLTYRVVQLNQTQRTIVLARADLYNNTCPSEFHDTNLVPTLFKYNGPENGILHLFYGCNTTAISNLSIFRPDADFLFSCNSSLFNSTGALAIIRGAFFSTLWIDTSSKYCSTRISVPMLDGVANQLSDSQLSLGEALMQGFSVRYVDPYEDRCSACKALGGDCGLGYMSEEFECLCGDEPCPEGIKRWLLNQKHRVILGVLSGIVAIVILSIIIWYIRRRRRSRAMDLEINQKVDKFLLNHGSLAPKRYTYMDIKKITQSFTDKLGQGGFGVVYKGKLPDGRPVAIKVLTDTTDDGEEFINEVVSISRTSHVNIVNFLGFCYERKIKALVYEFMPNKSLDKFIYKTIGSENYLEWEKLYKIAVGVARGLEYLHAGCNTRIVHFDIKPQNILLDEDFCPKIADFGLAKLGKEKQSMISMLGARGTIGYIAPEVFSRNFGGVSHKSDVYSYGMMLLEMAGRQKNSVIEAIQLSENYFPEQIYEHVLVNKEELDDGMSEEREEIARKLLLVGIWCIQTAPSERPSMTKVVEMLQGSLQSIEIPPKPSLFSSEKSETQLFTSFSVSEDIESLVLG